MAPFKFGNFEFTNLKFADERYSDKAIRIMELLDGHPAIKQFIGDRPCRTTLHLRTTETPADVRDLGKDGVEVNLASYFFEKYDVGQIMGMLAHEIALHPLASRDPEIRHEESFFQGVPLAIPGLENKNSRTMNTEGAGDPEHIMAAFPSGTRHKLYRETVLTAADQLARDAALGVKGAKPADVTSLIDAYLMDVASIAVTNDNRINAAREPGNTAKAYNAYKEQLLENMPAGSPVRAFLPPDKGALGVLRDFARFAVNISTRNQGDSIQQPARVADPETPIPHFKDRNGVEFPLEPAPPRHDVRLPSATFAASAAGSISSTPRNLDAYQKIEDAPKRQRQIVAIPPLQQIARAASAWDSGHVKQESYVQPVTHAIYAPPRSPRAR
ncbi:hypothetical protein OHA02_50950 [Streptomyces phaeochromogenes]|nr:hypothetical protein [Streptomyces phaeochromogenes]